MSKKQDMSSLSSVPKEEVPPSHEEAPSSHANQSQPAQSEWREWLRTHGPKLLLFARQQGRSQEDAEDILQDAVVKLVGKVHKGEFVGGSDAWQAYIYTTIRRLAIDLSRRTDRRKKREDVVSDAADKDTGHHPWFEGNSSDDEVRGQLEEKLKELPPKFAEVIVMKVWGEKTFAEIGEALEISQNTAASRYRYGLEALKKSLASARRRGDLSI